MSIRTAQAEWKGSLKEGAGHLKLGSGVYEGAFTFASRFEEAPGTNPEELIGAALAGCYTMFLSSLLTKAGFIPEHLQTNARVHLEAGPTITLIELTTVAKVPQIEEAAFQEHVATAKSRCPVSKALTGVEITLSAKLA
jgi:osmotically inducible protein OsmC